MRFSRLLTGSGFLLAAITSIHAAPILPTMGGQDAPFHELKARLDTFFVLKDLAVEAVRTLLTDAITGKSGAEIATNVAKQSVKAFLKLNEEEEARKRYQAVKFGQGSDGDGEGLFENSTEKIIGAELKKECERLPLSLKDAKKVIFGLKELRWSSNISREEIKRMAGEVITAVGHGMKQDLLQQYAKSISIVD